MTAPLAHRTETLPSGTVVHTWSPPSSATGQVLLQHGFAEYAERYIHEHGALIPALIDRGFEVRAIDLPGHGRSPGRRGVTDTEQAVREHIAVRRLMSVAGPPLMLFGHSYGGMITAASVAREPGGVHRVILTGPVLLRRTALPLRSVALLLAAVAPAAQLPGGHATMTRDPSVAARARVDPLMYRGVTTFRVAATALDVAHRMWAELGTWRTPTTIFHGTCDEAAAHTRSHAFVEAIARSDVELISIPGSHHEVLHDLAEDVSVLKKVLETMEHGRP